MPTSRKGSTKKGSTKKTQAHKAVSRKKTPAGKRAANPGFFKPLQPSAELAAVVGSQPMPRTEITKRLWEYIKRHRLQDSQNKRLINADDKLRPVLGGKKQVSMFEMTKLVSRHVT